MTETHSDERPPPVVEIEITLHNSTYPFVYASAAESCRFELAEMVPREGNRYAEFFNVDGADPEDITELESEYESVDISVLDTYDSGALFEFLVSGRCPAYQLAELGALPRRVVGRDGRGRIVAEIPAHYQPSMVIEEFLSENPDANLVAKREKESITPMFTLSGFEQVLHTHLTDRQREVLETAFEAGYYDWPRVTTGEEIADELGISSATFSEHINSAERALLTVLFEGPRAQ